MNSLNILIVTEGHPPDKGGVSTSTGRIAKTMSKLGHEVIVLTYDRRPIEHLDAQHEWHQIDDYSLLRVGPFYKTSGNDLSEGLNDKQRAMLRRRFVETAIDILEGKHFKPELILSLYLINAGFISTFLTANFKCKHIAGVRGNDIGRNVFDPNLLFATNLVLKKADSIAYVNQHLHDIGREIFPEYANKSFITRNSIEPRDYNRPTSRNKILEQFGWPETVQIVCFLGTFREKKGCIEIIRAINSLQSHQDIDQLKFLMVSPSLGSAEKKLIGDDFTRLIKSNVIGHTGHLPHSEALEIASGADFLLLPSRSDGMANALLEGMSMGLCPIVSHIFDDLIEDEVNGLIVPHITSSAIEEAILRAIHPSFDYVSAGQRAKETVLKYPPVEECNSYLDLYQKLL